MRFYVETSVWNFLLAQQDLNKRALTHIFFRQALIRGDLLYISTFVLEEIQATTDVEQRKALLEVLESHSPHLLPSQKNAISLAERYIREGAMTMKHLSDALHIASATLAEMEFLVSWNMRQIARQKTRVVVRTVNALLGYRPFEIVTPEEVIDYEG
jgi:hypothetical protein